MPSISKLQYFNNVKASLSLSAVISLALKQFDFKTALIIYRLLRCHYVIEHLLHLLLVGKK